MGKNKIEMADELADLSIEVQSRFPLGIYNHFNGEDTSSQQFRILNFIYKNPGIRMKHLADLMCTTPPASSIVVDRLNSFGFIERSYDNKDRRKVFVKLTEKGKSFVENIKNKMIHKILDISANSDLEEIDMDYWIKIYKAILNDCG